MKKTIRRFAIIVLFSVFIICGCGKSETVKNVESLINGIGEVSVESGEAIKQAEEAYNALSEEEKGKVENADQISKKREEYDKLVLEEEQRKKQEEENVKLAEKKEGLAPFEGNWKPLFAEIFDDDEKYISVNTHRVKSKLQEIHTSEINVSADNEKCRPRDENHFIYGTERLELINDNGVEKLVSKNGVYVREEQYDEIFNKMFVHVTLTEDNISDYIGNPIRFGKYKYVDEWEDEKDYLEAYIMTSPAYENEGLVMLTYNDVKYEAFFNSSEDAITFHSPYPKFGSYQDTKYSCKFGRAEGDIWYIKKEYVKEISDGELIDNNYYKSRKITFTDGFTIEPIEESWRLSDTSVDELEY